MPRNEKGVNKAVIEQVAIALFSKYGYKNTSMNEIASKSKLSKRTVYKYFPSKLILLFCIFESYLKSLHDEILSITNSDYPIDKYLKESLKTVFNFSMQNISFMKLFWTIDLNETEGDVSPDLRQHIKLLNLAISEQMINYINRKGLTGWLSNYSAEEVVEMLSAANKGMVIQLSKDESLEIGKITEQKLLDFFLKSIDLGLK